MLLMARPFVLALILVASAGVLIDSASSDRVLAQPPPDCVPESHLVHEGTKDYCFAAFVDTAPVNPDAWMVLKVGTGAGAAAPPSMPGLAVDTTTFAGLTPGAHRSQPLGFQAGEIEFSTQMNVNPGLAGNIDANGQPPACGASGTLQATAPTAALYNALSSSTATSAGQQVGDAESQEPDPASTPTGMYKGITHEPTWYAEAIASGVLPPRSLHVGRSYGVLASTVGQISVNVLTMGPVPGFSPPRFVTVVVLGDGSGVFHSAGQAMATCAPFERTTRLFGTGETANWPGGSVEGGQTRLTLTGSGFFEVALSSGSNLDGELATDGFTRHRWNEWDNCRLAANPTQASSVDNGVGDACKSDATSGYAPGGTFAHVDLACTSVSAGPWVGVALDPAGQQAATEPPWAPCQDNARDGVLNSVDNCPFHANPDQLDTAGDGIGDACDPAPDIRGDGGGYAPPGTYFDVDDICRQEMDSSGVLAATVCFNRDLNLNFQDSANNGVPDFLDVPGQPCMQDHRSDSNNSGYSDSDETSPPGTKACTGAFPPNPPANNPALLRNALQECAGRNTEALRRHARSDVNVDGQVNILDVSLVAGHFGAFIVPPPPTHPYWRMDLNKDGVVNILDVSIVAGFFGTSVPPC